MERDDPRQPPILPPPGPAAPVPGGAAPEAPRYGGPVPPGGWQQPLRPPRPPLGELASWGVRLAAYLVDFVVVLVPTMLVVSVVFAGALGVSGGESDTLATVLAAVASVVIFAAVALLYAPVLMVRQGARNGQTLGKQLLGIRVVRDGGEPFGFAAAAVREILLKGLAVGIASSIIPLLPFLLDYLWPLWDDENRALHDMAASTHVVRA